jgi:hypothetical protein
VSRVGREGNCGAEPLRIEVTSGVGEAEVRSVRLSTKAGL